MGRTASVKVIRAIKPTNTTSATTPRTHNVAFIFMTAPRSTPVVFLPVLLRQMTLPEPGDNTCSARWLALGYGIHASETGLG